MNAEQFILKHIPLGSRVEQNDNTYYYEVVDGASGSCRLKVNDGEYAPTAFHDFPVELKAACEEMAIADINKPQIADAARIGHIRAWYDTRPNRNQEEIARFFAKMHKDVLFHSYELNRFLVYDGKTWKIDKAGDTEILLSEFIRDVIEVIDDDKPSGYDEEAQKRQKAYWSWAVGLNNYPAIGRILSFVSKKCAIPLSEFDTNDLLFNVRNGTIDLRTGKLRKHNPKDKITLLCDVDYYRKAIYEKWDATLLEACGRLEYVRYLQKEFGYCLTGSTDEELLIMLFGLESTGKSTFYEPIMEVLGDYGHYMAFSTLKHSDKDGGAPREDLLRLRTCRLVMCSEVNPKTIFDTALVKKITSGEKLVARGLHARDSVEYSPKFKVCIGTNYAPVIPYDDGGSYRRIKVNPFLNTVTEEKKDKWLKSDFKNIREATERILAWLVEGCVRWHREGINDLPREVLRANAEYRRSQNPLSLFLEDYCVEDRFAKTPAEKFIDTFNHVRSEYGAEEIANSSFGRFMTPLGYEKYREPHTRGYKGIRLKTLKEIDDGLRFDDIEQKYERIEAKEQIAALRTLVRCGSVYADLMTDDSYLMFYPTTDATLSPVRSYSKTSDYLSSVINEKEPEQQKVAYLFVSLLQKLKGSGLSIVNDKDQLLKVASERIKSEHPELCDYDVLSFAHRLAEYDVEVQSLLAVLVQP
jgi:P4 family phage/plasmid primase-like protien